jgi:DNA-binding CsgD family transcriptional regulator
VLRGRETEQSQISALLDEAWASRGGALMLRGPAGVGKSALLADAMVRAEGMLVLRTQGIESEADLALASLNQLLRPLIGLADRLTPPQAEAVRVGFGEQPTGGRNDRFLVYSATLSLIAEAAESQPVLCVVDDAQWLDEGSAHALLFSARRLGVERIAMLFAARDGDEPAFEAPGVPSLSVAGLGPAAAHGLLEESAGRPVDPGVADQLLAATDGNPLALVELPTALTAAELSGQAPLPASLPVTEGVERAFLARVRRLPAPSQTLLLVAAAEGAGELAAVQMASASLGIDPGALEAVERSGLAHTRGGRLEFRHPLVRSSVYGAATSSMRRDAHAALAQCLTARGDPDRSVWHRAAAAVAPDETIATQLEQAAGRAAARGAPAAASAAFERAAQLTADPEPRARRIWLAAEQARLAGHHLRATSLLESARSTTTDPLLLADVDLLTGAVELVAGSAESAEQVLMRAARGMQTRDPGRALHLLVIAAQAASLADHTAAEIEIGRLADAMPRGAGDPEQFFLDLLVGCGQYVSGETASSTRLLRDVVRKAQGFDESMLITWAGRAAFYLGDDDAAHRLDSRAVARARAVGAIGDMLPPLQRLALSEIFQGQWSTATANAVEALRFARETGQHGLASLPSCWLALLAAYRGDASQLHSHLDAAGAVLPQHPMVVASESLLWARAVSEAAAGDVDAAMEHLRRVTSQAVSRMSSLDRIEIAFHAGHATQARAWLTDLSGIASSTGAPWASARVEHCRALLAGPEEADAHYAESLRQHDAGRRPFERARTELAYGEFLRRSRRRVDARAHLRRALTTFDDLGARPWSDRASQELRASGESIRRQEPNALPKLTAQELQVANLVTQGLSNREVAAQLFISPRTVDFHLRNVFTKLGVSSRGQLAQRELELA